MTPPPEDLREARASLLAFHLVTELGQPEALFPSAMFDQLGSLSAPLGLPQLAQLPQSARDGWSSPGAASPKAGAWLTEILPGGVLRLQSGPSAGEVRSTPDAGEVFAARLHDCIAVDLTLRLTGQEGPVPLSALARLNPGSFVSPARTGANLGQTVLLTMVPGRDGAASETLARECVRLFLLHSPEVYESLRAPHHGWLLGSSMFEFTSADTDPSRRWHILVWFLEDEASRQREAEGDYYFLLLHVLLTRAKILYCYHTAQQRFVQGSGAHQKLRATVETFGKASGLEEFKTILQQTPHLAFRHSLLIEEAEIQMASLKANSVNFRDYLDSLQRKTGDESRTPFESFLRLEIPHLTGQIEYDLSMLRPIQEVFQSVISSIRGQVEIMDREAGEKAAQDERHRDRLLQVNLAFVGAVIAFAQIALAVFPQPLRDLALGQPKWAALPIWNQLLLSLADMGILMAFVTLLAFPVRQFVKWRLAQSS